MRKKSFMPKMMSRTLLITFISFLCPYTSTAQETIAEKIDYVKALFGGYMSSSEDEQKSKIISYYDNCTEEQKEAILSYMVQAITDSLKAENKQFAMNCIDYYRLIASPDDEYLSSLVVTEGRYYYEQMDASKLSELSSYLNNIAAKSTLDYSSEVSELNRMSEEVAHGCDDLIGYWVADFSGKEKADPFFVCVYRNYFGEYHVTTIFSSVLSGPGGEYYMDLSRYGNHVFQNITKINPFLFRGIAESSECVRTSPITLSYVWSSEKMKIGKEELATFLRSGVRSVGNSIIGEMARSNSHSFGSSLLGSAGAMIGEVILNSLIDRLSISKKRIWAIQGDLSPIDKNNIGVTLVVDVFTFRSDNSGFDEEHLNIDVKLVRCRWDDLYVKNNIAFADDNGLRQASLLSKKERKSFYKSNHKARRAIRKRKWSGSINSCRALRKYNRLQLERLKEYNQTH